MSSRELQQVYQHCLIIHVALQIVVKIYGWWLVLTEANKLSLAVAVGRVGAAYIMGILLIYSPYASLWGKTLTLASGSVCRLGYSSNQQFEITSFYHASAYPAHKLLIVHYKKFYTHLVMCLTFLFDCTP